MADYQVRRSPAWYRHVTLDLLAHAYLAVTRARAAAPDIPELPPLTGPEVRWLLCRLVRAPAAPAAPPGAHPPLPLPAAPPAGQPGSAAALPAGAA